MSKILCQCFFREKETNWEYIDCVLFPDGASERIGAVLFWDNEKKISWVAFFNSEGHYQICGTDAKTADEPDFKYLGDGSVTFKLETNDGVIYNHTLTISIDGSDVAFKAEADLP